jgi:hypothetical protein
VAEGHADVVARIKEELEARGVPLVGPCGAFQIVKRVAWALRHEGAGLLAKPQGNNCEGFATDIIAYPDGRIFDVLTNGGGDEDASGNPIPGTGNGPVWNPAGNGRVDDISRCRAAIDPGDAYVAEAASGSAVAASPQAPSTSASDTDRIVAAIDESTAAILAALKENTAALASVRNGFEQSVGALVPALRTRVDSGPTGAV